MFTEVDLKERKHPLTGRSLGESVVDGGGQRRISRLLRADKKARATQISTLYNQAPVS